MPDDTQALQRRPMTEAKTHIEAALRAMADFPAMEFDPQAEQVDTHLTVALDEATDWLARNPKAEG